MVCPLATEDTGQKPGLITKLGNNTIFSFTLGATSASYILDSFREVHRSYVHAVSDRIREYIEKNSTRLMDILKRPTEKPPSVANWLCMVYDDKNNDGLLPYTKPAVVVPKIRKT